MNRFQEAKVWSLNYAETHNTDTNTHFTRTVARHECDLSGGYRHVSLSTTENRM